MDYYDIGLCNGIYHAGILPILYTTDENSGLLFQKHRCFPIKTYYKKIYGKEMKLIRGLRFIMGSILSGIHAKHNNVGILHLHIFGLGYPEIINILIAKMMGFRIVCTIHDVESFAPDVTVPIFERIAYRLMNGIIAHNQTCKSDIESRFNVKNITLIPHGNYLDYIGDLPSKSFAREKLKISDQSKVLLFWGQIKPEKGLDLLLEAFCKIVNIYPKITLLIAGKILKDNVERYLNIIDQYKLNSHCICRFEYIPNDEVSLYYSAADLIIMPYRKIYQSGVLMMAMSYGKPVLASNLPSIADIIVHSQNGYLFPKEDTDALFHNIINIITHYDDAKRVGENALKLMKEKYSWNILGSKTAEYYRTIMSN